MGQRDAQREATRRRIVETALALFAEKGFEGASISAIAKGAGVSKGLVHHYFPEKDDLIRAVVAGRQSEIAALARAIPDDAAPREKLSRFAHAIAGATVADPLMFRLYLRALGDERTRAAVGAFTPDRREWLAVFQALGCSDPELEARFFQVSLLGILTHHALSPVNTPVGPLVDRLLHSVIGDGDGGR